MTRQGGFDASFVSLFVSSYGFAKVFKTVVLYLGRSICGIGGGGGGHGSLEIRIHFKCPCYLLKFRY